MAPGWRSPGGGLASALLLLLALGLRALAVSFYGDSYVELNIAESSTRTSLQLRFRTSKPHGLLFLAAGNEDHFSVELHSGYLQLRMNFGAGERVLHSQQSSRLNDLAWHLAELYHENDNVTLVLDKHYRTSTKMPGILYQLNIERGLYVGGSGTLDVPYLDRALTNFRGCIDDVLFNQHEILTSLRPYPGFRNVHEVSLGCSDEFFASEDEPISFFSSKSYVSFQLWNVQGEGCLECAIQTSAQRGLLLYHSGQAGDFIAMEIESGLIKAHIGKSKSRMQLSSLKSVSDNKWHSIELKFTAQYLQLMLDGETVKTSLPSHSKIPLLKGPLFVGGVDDSTRVEVIKLELTSVSGKYARGGSFKGCIRDLKANSEKRSLKNVLVTKDISAGCKTENSFKTNSFVVTTEKTPLVTAASTSVNFPEISKPQGKEDSGHFLVLNNLIVSEGGQAPLESKHIKVNLEFKKLGVRQSQIFFKIKEQPSHGYLRLGVEPEQEKGTFTMLDLWQGRVLYVHDGSEDTYDNFTFSISASSKKDIPPYLQGHEQYVFRITITPTNDVPELMLPVGNLFLLFENSKKRLTADVIKVSDQDTDSANLSLSVLGNVNTDAGFLENSKNPGRAIITFSNEDLKEGNIFFVHTGVKNSRIVLRASDGEKMSNTVVLRVMAVPLDYKVVNNTGIKVLQGSAALITLSHLAVETNAIQQEMEIRYEITESPQFGEIQRQHSSREWKQVNIFSQRSIERSRVRYCSIFKALQLENVTDHFKFKVHIGNTISDELMFPITVKWLRYNLLKHVPLEIEKTKKKCLNSDNLFAVMMDIEIPENELNYKLLSLPKKGQMLLKNQALKKNSTFSQKSIIDHEVEYELINRPHENTQDSFRFLVFTKYLESNVYDFKINIKAELTSIILTNNGLTITEGEGALITKSRLFAQTMDNKAFQYKVTKSPQHGKLKLINFSDSPESNDNLTTFSNQDIMGERVMYVHDDTETMYDEFLVIASTRESGEWMSSAAGTEPLSAEIRFNISVELKNDEKPVRVVDKVFHVVKNGQRLLTLADLCYHDPDSDFDDGQLLYTRRGIPNGDLTLVNDNTHRLYQFKQEDLEQKRVLFTHSGADYGRFVLFVTDGKHYTSSLLEVSASDPYVRLANNTGLLVQKGKERTITTTNLSAITNQDIRRDHEITYELFLSPKHGRIFVNNLATDSFTQLDLKRGHVIYRHDDSNNLVDTFNFTVYAKDIHQDAGMHVRMYLESHQRPPKIVHNNNLLVEEGKPVKISKGKLQVVHENSSPSEIVFTLRALPVHGYIRKFASEEGYLGAEQKPVLTFTQQDIDDGNVQYVQTVSDQLQDHFSLDVTNGIRVVSGIEISVDIIPKLIPLEVQNFTVIEGGSKALVEDYLKISNQHFTGLSCEFILVEPPKNGHVGNSRFPGVKLTKFTKKQVEQELIYYIHDDSEGVSDNFTVIANNTELWKQSLPQTIFVTVTSVNDEAPVISTNKILRVWVGSVTEITVDDLCAEDKDSSASELVYSITPPSNGHLALKSSPNKSILNFTQAHIMEGQLVFVHNGAMSGGFNFQVTDGLNFAPRQIFSITARTLVISLEVNKGLGVFPGSRKLITAHDLKAVTNDMANTGNRTITFTIVRAPKLGRLIRIDTDNTTQDISTFTQSMVDEGLVIYEHTHNEAVGWSAEDFFTFTVSSPPAALDLQVFHVAISYEINRHDQSSRLLANTGAIVQEGGKVLINKTNLDASNLLVKLPEVQRSIYEVWYQVISLPQHGIIVVGERNITEEKPNFSQYILNKFGIIYVHDNSESLADYFTFAVWLNLKSKSAKKPDTDVLEEMFNITIVPVNDQVPELKTKGLRLKVLQGDTSVLGPENLKVEDLDNSPGEIKYTVISNPTNGHLAMMNNLSTSIQDFTQADVDSGRVWFVQDGSSSSGIFYFSVTDGKHRPLYKLFNLEVTPVSLTLVNLTDVVLPQGQTSVTITNVQLSATTNGKSTDISYEITVPFKCGHLLIGNEQVTKFEQADLHSGRLSYLMTNLSASRDILEFMLFTSESNLTGQVFNIIAGPLVKAASDLKIPNQMVYKLRIKDLDATELANLTNSNPKFEVIVPPAHGRIVRRRSISDATFVGINLFTQNDIDRGVVLVDVHANLTGIDMLNDSFTFILMADDVQPAVGYFQYVIMPYDPLLVQSFTSHVPFLTHTDTLQIHTTSKDEPPVSQQDEGHTEALGKTVQSRWQNRNRWGNQNEEDSLLNGEPVESRSARTETTVKANAKSPSVKPRESSNPLSIIIPLTSVALLLIVAVISVCFFLMCHKTEKAKSLSKNQTQTIPSTPGLSPERSLTVPMVTVTPLPKGAENSTATPFVAVRCKQLLPTPVASAEKNSVQNSWLNLDPEMLQHCRKTNPTLKRNQYWV
ncbi:chondroitin sulfate proteoglycan 4-like isoform X1 [Gopherus flavomarginatus]|uniref:chondroitin sulfate proteoglycan 4-like isoform X1 n=1 Tax=Gopherus flavomarginatus TaxID=286002 RepID=UPI0021CBE6F8|nr:chondroitin sulfate proteoglycan 4-like isoform X1 [Gopherus flavomarginatus]